MTDKIDSALTSAFLAGSFGLPVAHENAPYEPAIGAPWAQLHIVPNQPSVATLGDGGTDAIDGFLQVSLFYPANTGAGLAKQKAAAIRDYFKAGRRFDYQGQSVEIVSAGRNGGRNDGAWYQLVVTIYWRAWVPR